MRDSMINTCGMNMRKLLEKKSEVLVQKYGVRNVELEILLFLYHSSCIERRYGINLRNK